MAVWFPGGLSVSDDDNGKWFVRIYDHDVLIYEVVWKKHDDGRWGLYNPLKMEDISITGMVQGNCINGITYLYSIDYLLQPKPGTMYIDTGFVPTREN